MSDYRKLFMDELERLGWSAVLVSIHDDNYMILKDWIPV